MQPSGGDETAASATTQTVTMTTCTGDGRCEGGGDHDGAGDADLTDDDGILVFTSASARMTPRLRDSPNDCHPPKRHPHNAAVAALCGRTSAVA